ncbi:pyrophosphatase PpaX [Fonticella tunisiensis]|uniref:Pyrophosphatase PpaX n=1 Tax=Fonticella tunisiensis TaxID=1096341 RepID=A0A4R7KNY0_9CLOT|nr:pyrophosphatase PpaX [Fonticella tunisiensis]TDT58392.1 pyrophosphatase PpaX [Fonticella tunisiensis]
MINAVLFDLDGTLIDTNELIVQSFKYTFKKHLNIDISKDEIVKFFGEPLHTTLARYDEKNADRLLKDYREYNESIHDSMIKGIEGAEEVLKELKNRGIKLGIVTSKRRTLAERGLNIFNLLGLMDVVITPEDTLKHKPEGEPAVKACKLLGVSPEEALMVGDSPVDILCGKNAGTKTCFVKYSAVPFKDVVYTNPDYVIVKLRDLLDIVEDSTSHRFDGASA